MIWGLLVFALILFFIYVYSEMQNPPINVEEAKIDETIESVDELLSQRTVRKKLEGEMDKMYTEITPTTVKVFESIWTISNTLDIKIAVEKFNYLTTVTADLAYVSKYPNYRFDVIEGIRTFKKNYPNYFLSDEQYDYLLQPKRFFVYEWFTLQLVDLVNKNFIYYKELQSVIHDNVNSESIKSLKTILTDVAKELNIMQNFLNYQKAASSLVELKTQIEFFEYNIFLKKQKLN